MTESSNNFQAVNVKIVSKGKVRLKSGTAYLNCHGHIWEGLKPIDLMSAVKVVSMGNHIWEKRELL